MTVNQSITFLRGQRDSLFSDQRFDACADNLESAYNTLCKIRSVASSLIDELSVKYNANPNEECRVAINALSDIFNMTGWATDWRTETFELPSDAKGSK